MKKIEKSWQNNGKRESKGEKTEREVRLYLNFLSELSLYLFIYIFKPVNLLKIVHFYLYIQKQVKTESTRKLSNFNFQWTKTLFQDILLKNIASLFLHFSRAKDVISHL